MIGIISSIIWGQPQALAHFVLFWESHSTQTLSDGSSWRNQELKTRSAHCLSTFSLESFTVYHSLSEATSLPGTSQVDLVKQ